MDRDIVKVVMVVLALLLVLGIFLNKPNSKKESIKYKNEESEVLVADEYANDVSIDDVLLFDYANMCYQNYLLNEDVLTLYYQETCEKTGDDYDIKVFGHDKELSINVVVGESEYDEGDDLYYTSYYLQIRLPDNIEKFELQVFRDNAKYSVNCQIDEFSR